MAEAVVAAAAGRQNSAEAAIAARKPQSFGSLPVGMACWYRLRFNGELVPARVIDTWTDDFNEPMKLMRPKSGCVHLEIFLDQERHHAADERGLRQNVAEGSANGQFLREKPEHEDDRFEALQQRKAVEYEINRKRAQGPAL